MSDHPCPGGCGRTLTGRKFTCRPCWYRLPTKLRAAINANYGRNMAAHMRAVGVANRWYREHEGNGEA